MNNLIEVFSLNNFRLVKKFKSEKENTTFLKGLIYNNRLYVGAEGGLTIFDWKTCELIKFIESNTENIELSIVLWNEKYIITNPEREDAINVYNIETQEKETIINLGEGEIRMIDKTYDSSTLLAFYGREGFASELEFK